MLYATAMQLLLTVAFFLGERFLGFSENTNHPDIRTAPSLDLSLKYKIGQNKQDAL